MYRNWNVVLLAEFSLSLSLVLCCFVAAAADVGIDDDAAFAGSSLTKTVVNNTEKLTISP